RDRDNLNLSRDCGLGRGRVAALSPCHGESGEKCVRKGEGGATIILDESLLAPRTRGDPTMRLTLRTLLAYLDDTLEPAQARLIGQKVAESEVAQELIERIKQLTRRRRLTAPPATGPDAKLDPNTLAEYLDNELPDEKLAEV